MDHEAGGEATLRLKLEHRRRPELPAERLRELFALLTIRNSRGAGREAALICKPRAPDARPRLSRATETLTARRPCAIGARGLRREPPAPDFAAAVVDGRVN